ncbi:LAETG motif-containing sortase-dependent surface protein [Streptomyces sp. G1]|uniref:LAETG motif-containing sortase-dependent surface protein n=1 Tax=Streptomyces sp. G1 TaxID=361572 RepID=UPI00202EA814|nr:LAETG motif-containing sortase-dependent surface protein [Streptomyces sp. G1]MCM1975234.1 LPXTG cell wall anchor domain-containing protein [Streptomyces sp. G1]
MSARTAALRTASASVVAAAIAGTVLMPMTASADESNPGALKTTMSAPVPSGPLTRGGATETFELTVANTTDKVSSYHPWMLLDPTGASPLQQSDVVYKVEGLTAPATDYAIGQQDGEWQGLFYPAGKNSSAGFEIPANGKLTWKVTIGLGKSYPTTNGDFKLRAASFMGEVGEGGEGSLTFKTDPSVKTGKLESSFKNAGDCKGVPANQCREMDLTYKLTGDGEFAEALAVNLNLGFGSNVEHPNLQVEVLVDGKWIGYGTTDPYNFMLPTIPKGLNAASGEHAQHLRFSFGPHTDFKKATEVTLQATIGLAEGNTYAFAGADTKFQLAPKTTTPISPAPTSPAPTSPAPTTPAPTGSATTAPVTTAPAATTTPATGNTPKPTGSLAHTGSDSNTALYSGLAAVLIGLGGAAAWFARRRRTVRG